MKDLIKGLNAGGAIADDLLESGEERQKVLSERHAADMLSDSWLSKNVRPITLLFALFCQLVIVVGSLFTTVDPWVVGQVGTILATSTGFYFSSRKSEKMAANNAEANIKIEEMKIKHSNKIERKEVRAEIRAERRAERAQEKEN